MKIIKSKNLDKNFFSYQEPENISIVKKIIEDVKKNGDEAIKKYTHKFDKVILKDLRVDQQEIKNAYNKIDVKLLSAIKHASKNIKKFARQQLKQFKDFDFEIEKGVFTGQKIISIDRVGIYVPAGKFPLVSTLLMCAIPASIAGVSEIVVCSAPSYNNSIHPNILACARWLHIKEIYKIGGVQAIAALAYGTETIKKVDKIVGPGNIYVAQAKKEIFGPCGIDFVAGPTEIMIIADNTANPTYVAIDLLAQAEHDCNAQIILITNSAKFANNVKNALNLQMGKYTNKNGLIILVDDINEAIDIANKKACEHLQLQIRNPDRFINKLKHFGTLFIGENSAIAFGDYSSGLNHTLPTNTCARYTGGLSVKDFLKIQTTLKVTKKGISKIGYDAKILAEREGLDAHAKSILIREK
jgi:histidinol dehydrogenase